MVDYSPHIKLFQEIIEEYEFASRNLDIKTRYYNNLISKGLRVPSAGAYYKYSSLNEAQLIRKKLQFEIDRKYTLELTAAFEAKSVYYFKYVLKRRNPMYLSYINNVSPSVRHGISHLMYQHLIIVYKEFIMPVDNIVYAEFKNLVEFRNWLAHGRGWELSPHLEKFDFSYSIQTIFALISLLPNYPETLKN
jgi:hypothetical protein